MLLEQTARKKERHVSGTNALPLFSRDYLFPPRKVNDDDSFLDEKPHGALDVS